MTGSIQARAAGARCTSLLAAVALTVVACGPAAAPPVEVPEPDAAAAPAPQAAVAGCAGPTLTATAAGTLLTLVATSCLASPEYRFWARAPGATTSTLLRDFGGPSVAWQTAGLASGRWTLTVEAREAGTTTVSATASLARLVGTVCTKGALKAAAGPGTAVALTASATCSPGAVPEYRLFVRRVGDVAYREFRPYGTSATASWDAAGARDGLTDFVVYVRALGNASTYDATATTSYVVGACTGAAITATPGAGASLDLSATATCPAGVTPEFRFVARPLGAAVDEELRAYGTAPAFTWDTGAVVPGRWTIGVQLRGVGHPATAEATGTVARLIGSTCSQVAFTATRGSGAAVTLAAAAVCSGGAVPEYRFAARPPGATAYQDLRGWGSTASFQWTTSDAALGNWSLVAYTRGTGNAGSYEAARAIPFTVADVTPPVTTPSVPGGDYGPVGQVVTLACADAQSGCAGTTWSLGGGEPARPYLGQIPVYSTTDLCFRSVDAAGNAEATRCEHYVVDTTRVAAYDAGLKAPRCAEGGAACDSGPSLVLGRALAGPEQHTPNTLGATCQDGFGGTYHASGSVDRVRIATVGGGPLASGAAVRVEATVWVSSITTDSVDLYLSPGTTSPAWTLLATLKPTVTGSQTVVAYGHLPSGTSQAVRAQLRTSATTGPCVNAGAYADRDDLAFTADPAPPDAGPPTVDVTRPAPGERVSSLTTVEAVAQDDVGVVAAELLVDGVPSGADGFEPWSFQWDASVPAPGLHSLQVRAWDLAGNMGLSSPVVVLVEDRVAPTVSITAPAEGALVGRAATVTMAAADAHGVARVELLADGVVVGSDDTSPWSVTWDTTGRPAGAAVLTARAFDTSGNSMVSTARGVIVDNVSPSVTLSGIVDGAVVGDFRWTYLTVTAADDRGVALIEYLVDGTKKGGAAMASYAFPWTTASEPLGAHTVVARATDVAGNVTVSPPVTVTVVDDTVPVVYLSGPYSGTSVRGTVPLTSSAATDNRGVARVEYWAGSFLVASMVAPPWAAALDTTLLADGPVTLVARAYDAAGNRGNSGPIPVTVDNTPPVPVVTTPAAGATVGGSSWFTASATDLTMIRRLELFVDGVSLGYCTTSPCSKYWAGSGKPLGGHVVSATATDDAGNVGAGGPVAFQLTDLVAPTVAFTSPASGSRVTGTLTFTATASDGYGVARVEFFKGDALVATVTSPPYQLAWIVEGPESATTWYAKAYDASGNVGTASVVVTPDLTPPTVALTAPAEGQLLKGLVALSASASDGGGLSRVEFLVDGASMGSDVASPYESSLDTLSLPDGPHRIAARAVDLAGNATTSPAITAVVDNTPPSVVITSPWQGEEVRGDVVIRAAASDATSDVVSVTFYDGATALHPVIGSADTSAPFAVVWQTATAALGPHDLTAEARDAAGNVARSPVVVATNLDDTLPARWSNLYRVPTCAGVQPRCTADTRGRGPFMGPAPAYREVNYPNNLGVCGDSTQGFYLVDPSIEGIQIRTLDGFDLTGGKQVEITAPYFGGASPQTLFVDLWYTADVNTLQWTYVRTIQGPAEARAVFTLPEAGGAVRGIRAHLRSFNSPDYCGPGMIETDDLAFAVGPGGADLAPPRISITSLASGQSVYGDLPVEVWARDNRAVATVALQVDGATVASSALPPFTMTLPGGALAPGQHLVTAVAVDTAGHATTSLPVPVVAVGGSLAVYGAGGFTAPGCQDAQAVCDSGPLLTGRGPIGPEPNAPNTLGGGCADATAAPARGRIEVDALRVSTLDGTPLAAGKRARVDVTFRSGLGLEGETIDLFWTGTPSAPTWSHLGTVTARLAGALEVEGLEFDLPAVPLVAVRASYRARAAGVTACDPAIAIDPGSTSEADDLVFAVAP